ncbi:unnamed protein product, partial [Laminaria digitata]
MTSVRISVYKQLFQRCCRRAFTSNGLNLRRFAAMYCGYLHTLQHQVHCSMRRKGGAAVALAISVIPTGQTMTDRSCLPLSRTYRWTVLEPSPPRKRTETLHMHVMSLCLSVRGSPTSHNKYINH